MPKTRASSNKAGGTKMQKTVEEDEYTPQIQDLAHVMRIESIKMVDEAGSGHPTSCSSMAELISSLFFHPDGMKFRPDEPRAFENDKFILSKGHAAPILYSAWSHAGHIPSGELMNLRKIDNDLEGHPTPRLDFVDVATGSLGQGLNAACGMAYSMKYFEKSPNRVFCLMGDGEMAEGSNWEAMNFASYHKLDNLVAIVDINRLGQSAATSLEHHIDIYASRFEAFGFNTITVDGHNVPEIVNALKQTQEGGDKPYAILAQTLKGKYFTEKIENLQPWHGKPLGSESPAVIDHLKTMITNEEVKLDTHAPEGKFDTPVAPIFTVPELKYKIGDKVAPRKAFGEALRDLGDQSELIIGVDADVKNSTMLELLKNSKPDQFIDCFIAEQNLVGVSIGVGTRGRIPFCGTFATFFTRAFDHIRMGAISQCNVKFVGTHCGVSIGQDGPSQMGLEDISMFRSVPNCVVLYPSDATSSYHAATLAANHKGMVFIRLGRPDSATFYDKDESFSIGQSKVAVSSDSDKITLVVAGITFDAALAASSVLKEEGINVRIIDIFSVKPVDKDTLLKSAEQTNNTILCVEDHYPEGGIYEAVCGAVASHGVKVHSLAVGDVPRSGKPEELLKMFKIDSDAIVEKVRELTQ
jgi:transketolase